MKKTEFLLIKFFVVVVMVLYLIIPSSIQAEPLRVGVLDFPPFYVVKSEFEVSGILADIIRKTLDRAGVKYVVSGFPPKRLYFNLADGTTQLFMGIRGVPEYEGHVLYSNIKIEEIEVRLYTLKDKPLLSSLNDLKGKKVITQRGYSYGGISTFLEDPANNITVDPTDGHDILFKKLIRGRADYLLDYNQPAESVIKKDKITGLKYSIIKKLKVQFIISKQTPDAENLLKKIDAAYLALKKEGAFK